MIKKDSGIFIFEDYYKHYKLIADALEKEGYQKIFPKLEGFLEFKIIFSSYVIKPSEENEKILKEKIDSLFKPSLFLLDLELFEIPGSVDASGALLRREFINVYYPDVPVIFISKYTDLVENYGIPDKLDKEINKFYLGKDKEEILKNISKELPKVIAKINNNE